jgi:hypothetical protein
MDEPNATPADTGMRLGEVVLAPGVNCRRCGYILHGLSAEGTCPECGLNIADTLRSIVDPAASRLPRLADPGKVGRGLWWLILCCVGALLGLVADTVIHLVTGDPLRQWRFVGLVIPRDLPLLSALMAGAGLWAVFRLKPQSNGEASGAIWRDLLLLLFGLLGWVLLAMGLWLIGRRGGGEGLRVPVQLVLCLSAGLVLLGTDGVLRTIGRRSRIYRQSHAARQQVLAMIAAVAGAAIGVAARGLVRLVDGPAWIASSGTVLLWVSTLMAVIGLLYMLLNAWWIRAALCSPAPLLRDLLSPAEVPPIVDEAADEAGD